MSIAHSNFDSLPDGNAFSEPDLGAQIVSASGRLSAFEVKLLIRDTQHELTSAWKFYMGIGCNKQALVLVDNFTSLPLSVARHCANVVVHGMQAEEARLLQSLATHKLISNYTCVDALACLTTRFDLVVLAVTRTREHDRFPPSEEIRRLVHPWTEFWAIATNEFSLGYAKELLCSFWGKHVAHEAENVLERPKGVRLQFGVRHLVLSRHVKRYLVALGCTSFTEIGFESSMVRMQTVRLLRRLDGGALLGRISSLWQRRKIGEMAIGAAVRGNTTDSFLGGFLKALPNSELSEGSLERYYVSPGGKVLLFASFQRPHLGCKTLVKLPLNEHAQRRLAVNQTYLKFLESSDRISRLNCKYFPQPMGEGIFERQQFYAESMLEGISGDTIKIPYGKQKTLINEIFYFWNNIQTSLKTDFYFDKYIFSNIIEKPLRYVFYLTGKMEILKDVLEILLRYLQSRFMHRGFILSLVHGDFSLKNIIFCEKDLTLSGIIDWDRACTSSFPLFDVFHFFVRMQEISYYKSPIHTIIQMLGKDKDLNDFHNVLDMYCKEFFVESDTIVSIVIMYWIHLLSGFEHIKFLNKSFVKKSFDNPLELLVKIIS
jgi:hypothetical protein